MKTLLIHPKDPTTDFLSIIYSDYKNDENWTIINEYIGKRLIKKAIKEHDRIIMMGHGTEKGLYDPDTYNNIIDGSLVYLLHEKKDSIYIWCNADVFVEKHGLTGVLHRHDYIRF